MIKMSSELSEVVDVNNPESMRQWMIAVKQCIDELARKAQSLQMEERTIVPTANDLEVQEFVPALIAGLRYIYTKSADGTIHFIAVT